MVHSNEKPGSCKRFFYRYGIWFFVLCMVAIIVMIIFTAVTYEEQIAILTETKPSKIYQEPKGLLYSCPSLTPGLLFSFDGGPTNATGKILDLLDSINVSALFFVSKEKADLYQDVVRRIANKTNDHELGSSGYNNTLITALYSNATMDEFKTMITTTEGELENITGVWKSPRFYRPPEGQINKELYAAVVSLDYTTMLWTWNLYDVAVVRNAGTSPLARNGIVRLIDGDVNVVKFLENLVDIKLHQHNDTKFPWPILSPKECCPKNK